jgi:RNA polymerase sigma factor (sigma-70 family)
MSFDPAIAAPRHRAAPFAGGAMAWGGDWSQESVPPLFVDETDAALPDPDDAFEASLAVVDVARAPFADRTADELCQCMSRIVERDPKALAALYDACASRVFAVVLRILPRHQQAEEVVEDCFWQVWREAPRYQRERGSVLAWVITIARNRAIDALRRHDVIGRHELPLDDVLHEHAQGVSTAPSEQLETVERDHCLHRVLLTMEPIQRQMLALAFFRGLTHQEIAAHSGLALGTVKSHLRRALVLLRERCVAAGLASERVPKT